MMHSLVWNHHRILPEWLLTESFLDPVWCQCTVCDDTWLISPLLSSAQVDQDQARDSGLACSSCDCVLCPGCVMAADARCPCGGTFRGLHRPNGRKRRGQTLAEPEVWDWRPPTDTLVESAKDLDLYFGFEGRVPIGVDPSFPIVQTANADDHLTWAETLVDAGVFYQAQQQLDLLREPDASSARAKANWLCARLDLVRLHNASERSRRHLDSILGTEWEEWVNKIKTWLNTATMQAPDFGPAWLLKAQVYLDPICGQDFAQALQCAQRARELLGESPAVLLALGQALRGSGRPSEAAAILRRLPPDAEENGLARRELELAELEERCQLEPLDVEAHLRLGRWCLRHKQQDKAREIFMRLVERCPDRAEGYYGLAQLAFFDSNETRTERLTKAHRLCREVLNRNPDFGLAHELLGTILYNLRSSDDKVAFSIEDPLDSYRRALQHDPTCDMALRSVAEDHIDRGELPPAIQLLERAAALDTDISMVYFILAAIYRGTRQCEKEDWARRKAMELAPHLGLSDEYQNKILQLCGFEY